MHRQAGATALISGFLVVVAGQAVAESVDARVDSSRAVVTSFAQALQQALQTAIKADGPVTAIDVCRSAAPAIAAQQSNAHGWQVGRTSLKPRNPNNAPDDWQRAVLIRFEAEKAAGKPTADLETWEVVDSGGQRTFRYMKAIPTGEVCLTCHGSDLSPELAAKLDALYPEDKARGYALGQLRGAFTVSQPMD